MFAISPIAPKYLFGENFQASFEVETNLSTDKVVFSGIVERGTFYIGDYVYVMNSDYKIFAQGVIKELIGYASCGCASPDDYVTNFEIATEMPWVDEPLYVVKLSSKPPQDVYLVVSRTYDGVFIDYACDLKTAICKYLNKDLVEDEKLEQIWKDLQTVQVQQIMRKISVEGKDIKKYSDRTIELILLS